MKNALIARCAALSLAAAVGVSMCGSGAMTKAAAPGPMLARGGASMVAARTLVLPTNAQVLAAVAAAVAVRKLPPRPSMPGFSSFGCMVFYSETTTPPSCAYGDPKGSHSIVLYGDSHAANWIAAFDTIGKYLHWKVVEIAKAQCQVPDFPTWNPQAKRPYPECTAFHAYAMNRIKQLHPDIVVMSSEGQGPELVVNGRPTRQGVETAWAAGLAKVIDTIKPVTGKVIVLGDFAYGLPVSRDCLPAHAADIRACNLRRSVVAEAHNAMEQRVARQHGALYVPTVPWFCTATVCPAVVAGISTRDDGFHVAPDYALWLSDALATAMRIIPAAHPA